MTLCHHLRAEQDIEVTPPKLRQDLRVRKLTSRRIAIHAHKPRGGKNLPQLLLKLFRARAEVFDVTAAAFRTGIRHGGTQIAVMADERAVRMVDERQ